jgi:ribose transport system permease protein
VLGRSLLRTREPRASSRSLAADPGRLTAPLVLLGLVACWALAADGLDAYDIQALAIDAAPLCLAAVAASVILDHGELDISIGALLVLGVASLAAVAGGHGVAAAAALCGAAVAGSAAASALIGRVGVARAGLSSLVVTTAALFVWSGLAVVVGRPPRADGLGRLGEHLSGATFWSWLPTPGLVVAVAAGLAVVIVRASESPALVWAVAGALVGVGAVLAGAGTPTVAAGAEWEIGVVALGAAVLGGRLGAIGVVSASIALTLLVSILRLEGAELEMARAVQVAAAGALVAVAAAARRDHPACRWRPVFLAGAQRTVGGVRTMAALVVALVAANDVVGRAAIGEPLLSRGRLSTTLLFAAVLGVLALAQWVVVSAGNVDLATWAVAGAAAVTASALGGHVAIPAALAVGVALGTGGRAAAVRIRASPTLVSFALAAVVLAGARVVDTDTSAGVPGLVATLGGDEIVWVIPYALVVWGVALGAVRLLSDRAPGSVWLVGGVLAALAGLLLAGATGAGAPEDALAYFVPSVAAVAVARAVGDGLAPLVLAVLGVTLVDTLLVVIDVSIGWRDVLWGLLVLALAAPGRLSLSPRAREPEPTGRA